MKLPILFNDHKITLPALIALVVLLSGLSLSIAAFMGLRDTAKERAFIEGEHQARLLSEQLQSTITRALSPVSRAARLHPKTASISNLKFHQLIQGEIHTSPGMLSLGWVPRITGDILAEFEAETRSQDNPKFEVYEITGHGVPFSVRKEGEYFPIQYLVSRGNALKTGLNLGAIPSRLRIMQSAVRQQAIAISHPLSFYINAERRSSIQAFHPVFENSSAITPPLLGYILGVYDIAALVNTLFLGSQERSQIVLYNASSNPSQQVIYSSLPADADIAGTLDNHENHHWTYPITVADQHWLAVIFPTKVIAQSIRSWLPYLGLLGGALLSLLLTVYLFLALSRALQVNKLTTELSGSQYQLSLQRQLKTDADSANLAKSQFLRAASHDLRQPLHTINLLTTLLKNSTSKTEQTHLIDRTLEAVHNMDDLFGALLDINLLESGNMQAQPTHFTLDTLLAKIAPDYEVQSAEKEVYLSVIKSSACVHTDPALLERILRNLLSNAVRYTQQGRILLGCRRQQNSVRLCIFDTGIGLSAAAKQHIFDAFYRADSARQLVDNGLGLGLAIVKETAALLGLNIGVESTQGKGTLFYIDVPYGDKHKIVIGTEATNTRALPDCRIWVIEDDAHTREAMVMLLSQWGCDVAAIENRTALQALLTHSTAPSLIIADYQLVNDTGLALITHACQHYDTAIPAIMITGTTDADVRADIDQSGYTVLIKPVKSDTLHTHIAHALTKP